MKLLITNDDGIDAAGIEALHSAARQIGEPIMVAPFEPLSGCSHRVTTDEPIRIERRAPGRFAISGTPADCVRVGLHRLVPDAAWILSGINHGGNLGADVHHSGTVAAVREGVLHGWPGIAVSQYRKKGMTVDWERAALWTAKVLADLSARSWEAGTFWNVNLPHLRPDEPDPKVVFCRLDPTPLPLSFAGDDNQVHYDGEYHNRKRQSEADVEVCFSGDIAVTQIRLF